MKNGWQISHAIIRNNTVPPVNISYEEIVFNGRKVVLIEVPKGKDRRPYQDNTGRFYIRIRGA